MSTPVLVNGRIYCVNQFLHCLDLNNGLRELWRIRDKALPEHAAIIASPERLLVVGKGELLLLRTDGTQGVTSRQRVFPEDLPVYAHPAVVGNHLFLRGETKLTCLAL